MSVIFLPPTIVATLIGVASSIPFNTFTVYLAPVAVAGMLLIWLVVALVFRGDFGGRLVKEPLVCVRTEAPLLRKNLIATPVMLAGFVLGFPIPLAARAGAAILLISRRIEPEAVFREIDLSLLVFFGGLFIVTGAIESVGLSGQL
ncbi:MAG: anion transporter, partial [Caldilinea sp.]